MSHISVCQLIPVGYGTKKPGFCLTLINIFTHATITVKAFFTCAFITSNSVSAVGRKVTIVRCFLALVNLCTAS